ncbi:MAG: SdrD B-like domain-containing protein, partial [Saprospiraceae bacterium]
DRYSQQLGYQQYAAESGAEGGALYDVELGGDIYHACFDGTGWILEGSSAACPDNDRPIADFNPDVENDGPNGVGEFYWSDYWAHGSTGGHAEVTNGGLGILKGKQEVVSNAFDPILSSTDGGLANTQGTIKMSTADGSRTGEYLVVDRDGTDLGKSGGLSEPVFLCNPAPLEIGNYVWCDSLENGIQDACERGISDIKVQLFDRNGALVGVTTSSATGQYYFNETNVDTTGVDAGGVANNAYTGMSYETQYFIVFG